MVKIQKKIKSSFRIFLNFFLALPARGNTDKRSPRSYERPLGTCPSKYSPRIFVKYAEPEVIP